MAQFTLTIADDDVARVTSALCIAAGKEISPENALGVVMQFISDTVSNVETDAARAAVAPIVPIVMS